MAINYNYKEVPTGDVNGVNVTFDVVLAIDKIDEVFIGGAPYYGVASVAGTTITLNEAVPLGEEIYIDYYNIQLGV